MKRCSKCGEEKAFSEFYKEKRNKDGLRAQCKVCYKEYLQQYRQNNKEYFKQYNKQYREDNKEYIQQYKKQYRQNNGKEVIKLWNQDNKERVRAYTRKRKAMKLAVNENYTPQDEAYTRQLFGHRCFNCNTTDNLEIDHHYPLCKGHALTRDNAVLLCKSCNRLKHTKTPEEFYTESELVQLDFMLNF